MRSIKAVDWRRHSDLTDVKHATIQKEHLASLRHAVPAGEIVLPDAIRNDKHDHDNDDTIRVACNGSALWLLQGSRAKHDVLSDYRRFEVGFMTPAKSGGFVAILAASAAKGGRYVSALDFGMYSDAALAAARRAAEKLEPVLGYRIASTDWGPDC